MIFSWHFVKTLLRLWNMAGVSTLGITSTLKDFTLYIVTILNFTFFSLNAADISYGLFLVSERDGELIFE